MTTPLKPSKKKILLIGSGMMTGPYIEYLLNNESNYITVASNLRNLLNDTLKRFQGKNIQGLLLDITKEEEKLKELISEHDIVASFVPPSLHPIIAKSCLEVGRNMITTSYVSQYMKDISKDVIKKGLIFYNEIGLDPGLDHVICHKVIEEEERKGNKILSFESWCGALPAPEVCDNPFRYKFSWSPKGALLAMNNSISQLINGVEVRLPSQLTLTNTINKDFHPSIKLEGYYNRDSFPYIDTYHVHKSSTVIRGTLRYQGSTFAFQLLKNIGLYDDTPFKSMITSSSSGVMNTFKDYIVYYMSSKSTKSKIDLDCSEYVYSNQVNLPESLTCPNQQRFYYRLSIFSLSFLDNNYILQQGGYENCLEKAIQVYSFLNLYDKDNLLNNFSSPIDALADLLEKKLIMNEKDRDMDFMTNIFEILCSDGTIKQRKIDMIAFGKQDNGGFSATAITVGTPSAVVTQMILNNQIKDRGVLTPTCVEVGRVVLDEIEKYGVRIYENSHRRIKF